MILPAHLALIMDGNGRWATQQNKARIAGHEEGAKRVRELTIYCSDIGIRVLTLYAFSTENWKRPKPEVDFLMRLLDRYLKSELPLYLDNNVRFETIGDLNKLSRALQARIADTKARTAAHTGLIQVLAINYGAKDEIVRAAAALQRAATPITEEALEHALDTALLPPVDMLIRTGGEQRLSNFLLWQAAYAELFFTPVLWPEFTPTVLQGLLEQFGNRERRFGGL